MEVPLVNQSRSCWRKRVLIALVLVFYKKNPKYPPLAIITSLGDYDMYW